MRRACWNLADQKPNERQRAYQLVEQTVETNMREIVGQTVDAYEHKVSEEKVERRLSKHKVRWARPRAERP